MCKISQIFNKTAILIHFDSFRIKLIVSSNVIFMLYNWLLIIYRLLIQAIIDIAFLLFHGYLSLPLSTRQV